MLGNLNTPPEGKVPPPVNGKKVLHVMHAVIDEVNGQPVRNFRVLLEDYSQVVIPESDFVDAPKKEG